MEDQFRKFREQLDLNYSWPAFYTFKFVVPRPSYDELLATLPAGEKSERSSSSGKYVSVTMKSKMASSSEVVAVYSSVKQVTGVIAL